MRKRMTTTTITTTTTKKHEYDWSNNKKKIFYKKKEDFLRINLKKNEYILILKKNLQFTKKKRCSNVLFLAEL